MANVTGSDQINFCNAQIRTAADKLSQAYYAAVAYQDSWNAIGGGSAGVLQMPKRLVDFGNRIAYAYSFCFIAEKAWFNLGATAFIPNDPTALVFDNGTFTAQDPNRPPMTGATVNAVMNRVVELQNWLLSATESFTDTLRNNAAAYNTVLMVSQYGPSTITAANAGNLVNRMNELRTNYSATNNTNLGTLLAAAVNPNPIGGGSLLAG